MDFIAYIIKLMPRCNFKTLKGQTLVVVIIGMAVSLAAGVAISSRALTALKGVSFTTQSAKAYAAAESGVEEGLKRVADRNFSEGTTYTGTVADGSFSYNIVNGGGSSNAYAVRLDKDKTQEIKLSGVYSNDGNSANDVISVCWDVESDTSDNDASLEMFLIQGTSGNPSSYTLAQKLGFNPIVGVTRSNGFAAAVVGDTVSGVIYRTCAAVTSINTPTSGQLLRIKALYNGTNAVVVPQGGASLPVQAQIITSTGTSGEASRKIEVTKTLPALPEIFDFTIFTTSPLEK